MDTLLPSIVPTSPSRMSSYEELITPELGYTPDDLAPSIASGESYEEFGSICPEPGYTAEDLAPSVATSQSRVSSCEDLVNTIPEAGHTRVHIVATLWSSDQANPVGSLFFGLEKDCDKTIIHILEHPPNCMIGSVYGDNLAPCHQRKSKPKKGKWRKVKEAFLKIFCFM